jgi:hypothetical protein
VATLYGGRGGSATTSDLYTIDPVTAVATSIGPSGFAITGLAFDPTTGLLYGVTSSNSAANHRSLILIDPNTGAGTLIGPLNIDGGSSGLSDIAFGADGTLYGYGNSFAQLYVIDTSTGQATALPGTGAATGGGISFVGGVLYHVPVGSGQQITTIDTTNGNQTNVVVAAFGTVNIGAAAEDSGVMYATNGRNPNSTLMIIDIVAGTATTVGIIFAGTTAVMDALAWSVVPPPPPFTGLVVADLPIRMFVTSVEGETLSILDHRATQRQFLYRLNAPAYTTGQVASDDNEINLPWPDPDSPANLTNNRRLLFALQRWKGATPPYQPIFGGIITTPEDQGSDAPTTRYTAQDPWQLLMSRPIRSSDLGLPDIDGLKFPDQSRASDIAVALLSLTDLVDGETHIDFSDSGLIEDSTPLDGGITFDRSLSVGEAWTQLCDTGTIDIHLDPIYDPHGRPTKCVELRIVAQTEGTAAGPVLYDIVMAWDLPGHSLMGINRLVDGTRLANRVLYFAGQGGVPAPLQSDAASIAAYGEYWTQQSFPGTHDRTTIALLALTELLIRRNGSRSIQFDPAPERVEQPIKDYNLGDYLPVWASRNLREPLGVDYDAFDPDNPGASGYQRIYAIPMNVDDNGVTVVQGIITSKENA